MNLAGSSVQYASSTGTTWQKTDLAGSLGPGQYLLVKEAQGSGGTTELPAPDIVGTIAMSATTGKVALLSTGTVLSLALVLQAPRSWTWSAMDRPTASRALPLRR